MKRYTGKFSVLRISDATVTEEINGVTVTSQKKQYKLNRQNTIINEWNNVSKIISSKQKELRSVDDGSE